MLVQRTIVVVLTACACNFSPALVEHSRQNHVSSKPDADTPRGTLRKIGRVLHKKELNVFDDFGMGVANLGQP